MQSGLGRIARAAAWLSVGWLTACSSPSPRYLGVTPIRTTEGGARYDIYRREDRVQVLRLDSALSVGDRTLVETAYRVVERETGCTGVHPPERFDNTVMDLRVVC
jgi:hypothetical protein